MPVASVYRDCYIETLILAGVCGGRKPMQREPASFTHCLNLESNPAIYHYVAIVLTTWPPLKTFIILLHYRKNQYDWIQTTSWLKALNSSRPNIYDQNNLSSLLEQKHLYSRGISVMQQPLLSACSSLHVTHCKWSWHIFNYLLYSIFYYYSKENTFYDYSDRTQNLT